MPAWRRRLPGVALVGVHDHHEGRAEEVARESGLAGAVGPEEVADARRGGRRRDADELPRRARRGSSSSADSTSCREADRRRKSAEATELVELAAPRARVLAVGHVERYNPAVEALLATGPSPAFIEGHRLGIFTPRSLDVDVVLDLMIHDLQIVVRPRAPPGARDPRRRNARR